VQVLGSRSGGLEGETCHMSSGMIDDLHFSILLYPQSAHNDIVDATIDISPAVTFVPSRKIEHIRIILQKFYSQTYFGNSMVTVPFGFTSTLLPQNLIFGLIVP